MCLTLAVLRFQRLGAYVVVVRDGQMLLTRVSPVGFPPGAWALPGGGVDHGESPAEAAVRELHEETGLVATSPRLIDVHDVHVVSPGRGDQFEDYHGVHLLYTAEIDLSVSPYVVDVGGTTDLVEWVDLDRIPELPLVPVVRHVLDRWRDYPLL